jgi:secondary thiamine-phosphate synthase enzyme
MTWRQVEVTLKPKERGCHLATSEIESHLDIKDITTGLAHIFIQHTSASLTLNENADPDVRHDLNQFLDKTAPENDPAYIHTAEGPDDMPAHIKSSLMGAHLTIPITQGRLNLGTWQGIYLNEHRNNGGARRLIVTVHGTTD